MKKQKGGALATVLMIAAIFLIVGMAVATITTHHLRISSSKGEAEKALLLAEAGVQQVIYTVEDFGYTSPLSLLSSDDKEKEKDLGDLLTKAFDGGGGADLPDYRGEGDVQITFDPAKPYYSTNNFYSSKLAVGYGNRKVPPYSVHVISRGILGTGEKKIEAIISKRWPFAFYGGNGKSITLWSTVIGGSLFADKITIGSPNSLLEPPDTSELSKFFYERYDDVNLKCDITGNIFAPSVTKDTLTAYFDEARFLDKLKKRKDMNPILVSKQVPSYQTDLHTALSVDSSDAEAKDIFEEHEYGTMQGQVWVGTGTYYYYIKKDATIKGNYKADGDFVNFKTDPETGTETVNNVKLKIKDGSLNATGTFYFKESDPLNKSGGGTITLDNGTISGGNMRFEGSTIEGQGIVASDSDLKLSSINVMPKEGETIVLYSGNDVIVSPLFTTRLDYSTNPPKIKTTYAPGSFPSTINGLLMVNKRLLIHPRARLTVNGMLVSFYGEDFIMANVDLNYNQDYAKPLNTYGKTMSVYWKELP